MTISDRFRGFLPVVVDVETGGFNANTDALLEIAAQLIEMDNSGRLFPGESYSCHVKPFEGANMDPKSLQITGIDPFHPLRAAYDEKEALSRIFHPIRQRLKETGCRRAVLVGHNPWFDLSFLKAAVDRTEYKRNPFHQFTTFDTATLGGLAFGQTVLSRAVRAAGKPWDSGEAHSALYDTKRTAELFCEVINTWHSKVGIPASSLTDPDRQ